MVSKYDLVVRNDLNWSGIVLDILEEEKFPLIPGHTFVKIFWFDVMLIEECNTFLIKEI